MAEAAGRRVGLPGPVAQQLRKLCRPIRGRPETPLAGQSLRGSVRQQMAVCATLSTLLQVLCRGQCYVPGSFAWALALSSARQQSRVVRCDLETLGDVYGTRNCQVVQRREGLWLH